MSSADRECIGHGAAHWKLRRDVSGAVTPVQAAGEPTVSLPSDLPLHPELQAALSRAEHHTAVTTDAGVLIAVNGGEFAGELYWVKHRVGEQHAAAPVPIREMGAGAIRWIARLSFGVVGIAGLCHGDACAARTTVYHVRPSGEGWTLETLAAWQGCPAAPAVEPGGEALLVATCGTLQRVSAAGSETVARWQGPWTPPPMAADMIAKDAAGTHYVSFGNRVAQLRKGYEPVWLIPPDCIAFMSTPNGGGCQCSQ